MASFLLHPPLSIVLPPSLTLNIAFSISVIFIFINGFNLCLDISLFILNQGLAVIYFCDIYYLSHMPLC